MELKGGGYGWRRRKHGEGEVQREGKVISGKGSLYYNKKGREDVED